MKLAIPLTYEGQFGRFRKIHKFIILLFINVRIKPSLVDDLEASRSQARANRGGLGSGLTTLTRKTNT